MFLENTAENSHEFMCITFSIPNKNTFPKAIQFNPFMATFMMRFRSVIV